MKKMFVLVLALVMAFAALPAFAQDKADWAFYGSVRMWTAWESVDEDTPPQLSNSGFFPVASSAAIARTIPASANAQTTAPFGTNYAGSTPTSVTDDDEMSYLLQGNSRIGANVKWGNVGGRFEYGHSSTANLRLLYGTWNFGAGTLLLGQDYGPYFYLVSGLCGPGGGECNGIGFGSIYTGRTPQIKLIFGGLQVAIERPEVQQSFTFAYPSGNNNIFPALARIATPNDPVAAGVNATGTGTTAPAAGQTDIDRTLPRLAVSYTFNAGPAQLFVGGIYNSYDQHFTVAGQDRKHSVDAWLLGAGTKMAFGPFYVNATFQYGENPNNAAGPWFTLYPSVNLYNSATDASEDSEYLAAQLILGFKITDSLQLEGGIVWQSGSVDDVSVAGRSWDQDTWTYYIGLGWSPAKNVFIVPEFGIIDYNSLEVAGQPDIDYGKLTWLGIKWQINF
jgi:hypothetical protein